MGFFDRNRNQLAAKGIDPSRLPPGQYVTDRFPVLHAGGIPEYGSLEGWTLELSGMVGRPAVLTWEQLTALPSTDVVVDLHCVTKWSKFDTVWEGVSLDTLLEEAKPTGDYLVAHCDGGYTTNLPLEDVTDGKAWIAYAYDGEPLAPEHGGPARLLVPHLYLWKSAKWVRRLEIVADDRPGFWETLGYHNRGDPWLEQRYHGD